METMNSRMDANVYGELLLKNLPAVIESDAENERLIAKVEVLQDREEHLLPEERRLLQLLLLLIEDYEERKYRLKAATPDEVLRELMRARGLRQKDLWGVFGSKGIASEVVRGRRAISRTQAKRLARFFHVSPALFL
jgi:HTH-type transcriptional regulator/antitoxin HigA